MSYKKYSNFNIKEKLFDLKKKFINRKTLLRKKKRTLLQNNKQNQILKFGTIILLKNLIIPLCTKKV